MKLRIYSDIHLEFGKFKIPKGDSETVLVLAGDIGVGGSALPWIERYAKDYLAVIYVAGNHEFYVRNRTVAGVQELLRKGSERISNLHFLENDKVTINGVDFLGCTLWTDMNNECAFVKSYCRMRMNDYKISNIRAVGETDRRRTRFIAMEPDHTVAFHKESVEFLTREIEAAENPVVVVTHHSPTIEGVDTNRYGEKNTLNYAYWTNLEHLMGKPKLWVFGHTHKRVETEINGTAVMSNPRGYETHKEHTNYHHRLLEIL